MCFEFAETRLWRAVLIRAVQDAMSKKLDAEHKADARNWICKKNLDFEIVCAFANVDSNALRSAFLQKEGKKEINKTKLKKTGEIK